jgi:hypothetical protein
MGNGEFEPAKWLKILTGEAYWARLELVHSLGKRGIEAITVSPFEAEADGEKPAVDEAEVLKKLAGKRIGKGRRWLNDCWTRFILALAVLLTMQMELIVATLFAISNIVVGGDRRIVKPRNTDIKQIKGTLKSEIPRERKNPMAEVVLVCIKFMVALWSVFKSPFETGPLGAASEYAPEGQEQKARKIVRKGVFNLLGNVYLRFTMKHRSSPYDLAELPHITDEALLRKMTRDFLAKSNCCKCNGVCKPAEAFARSGPFGMEHWRLQFFMSSFTANCRETSLREEHWLSWMGKHGTKDKMPSSFVTKATAQTTEHVTRYWEELGNRDLNKAPESLKAEFALSLKPAKMKRPNALGPVLNTLRMEMLTPAQNALPLLDPVRRLNEKLLSDRLRDMPAEEKESLQIRHAARVTARRQADARNKQEDAQTSSILRSPWGLGSPTGMWPIEPACIDTMLDKYTNKDDILAELRGLRGFPKDDLDRLERIPAERWLKDHGRRKAFDAHCQYLFGKEIDHEFADGTPDFAAIQLACKSPEAQAVMEKACWQKHYGLCQAIDEQLIPKSDLLRHQLGKIAKDSLRFWPCSVSLRSIFFSPT